ncbi:MAG: hypothetical protein HY739_12070 [Desulfobacterales bacterium]|nr:hypothetical protein [Desulfobacterales bacterium]
MTEEVDALRARIRELYPKRVIGDLTEKAFQHELTERTLDLYRALIRMRTTEGEVIVREHHVVRAHFRLTQSVLREPEQEAVSIFATDRRLFYLKSVLVPNRPPSADEGDNFSIEEVSFDRIESVHVRRQVRVGEMGVGGAMVVFAVLFYPYLSVTGPFMIGLGILGMLHGLLLPTRWVEVKTIDPASDPIMVYALRKKSGRGVVRFLREKTRRR